MRTTGTTSPVREPECPPELILNVPSRGNQDSKDSLIQTTVDTDSTAHPLLPRPTPSQLAQCLISSMIGEPFFKSAWHEVLMMHFAVHPEVLQSHVPFALDLRDGLAYVSLVAFQMSHLRIAKLGRLGRFLMRPIATHPYLNIRTYVRHEVETGIYFLSEWLPNRISMLLGPPLYGLPYRLGDLNYQHQENTGQLYGLVSTPDLRASLQYRGDFFPDLDPLRASGDSLDEFLLERYTAFTYSRGLRRKFRVWHPSWQCHKPNIRISDMGLLNLDGSWASHAGYIGAHYSHGFDDVWMTVPRFV